jgi:hypothetical protein
MTIYAKMKTIRDLQWASPQEAEEEQKETKAKVTEGYETYSVNEG